MARFQEKETDLELAAKIGQELLDRNRRLDDKVCNLESSLQQSNDLITQLKHELNLKTDLLHAYTDNEIEAGEESEDDITPFAGLGSSYTNLAIQNADGTKPKRRKLTVANVEYIEKKVKYLKEDNKKLQEEATEVCNHGIIFQILSLGQQSDFIFIFKMRIFVLKQLAKEAFACEQKEEKLVSDAVQHLTEANLKLTAMSTEYQTKVEESMRQKEEMTHLLAKVRFYF